eukprot:g6973.t1
MLSVVPAVVEVAEEALARRAKNKQQAAAKKKQQQQPAAAPKGAREPLLAAFLREAQFLVGADSSGQMKKDMAALRALLSPP